MFEYLITRPLGFLIHFIYNFVQNYGMAIILFTILIRLILMPLAVRSQKAMRKQQKLQPVLAELQKKYANDKEKLQVEMMKLYKENNVSMMGGCLPLLLQMPIIFGLYRVIQRPLTYLMNIDFSLPEATQKITDVMAQMAEKFPEALGSMAKYNVEQMISMGQIQLSNFCKMLYGAGDPWVMDFGFLGLDLSVQPSVSINYILSGKFMYLDRVLLILIPAIAVLTTWLSMKQTQSMQKAPDAKQNTENEGMASQMSKSMNLMMPIMTGIFAFTLPSGLGLYWIVSNLMQMFQQFALNLYFKNREDDFVVKVPERNRKNGKKR
ncbi:MAG: YidC/Oxa1 family membrane protein insertase [Ruminococcaceae bacterium]|nr:YidC/Oxa1 family membrane protein insertase [Oscillospiraceae bacterium]